MPEFYKMSQGRSRHIYFLQFLVLVAFFFIIAAPSTHAYEGNCGTLNVIENIIKKKKQPQYYAQTSIKAEIEEKCPTEVFYDSVYTIETSHFQIIYVLTGPHATTKEFADSTAAIMERVWDFYHKKRKMQLPKGISTSYHFKKKVPNGLYPVEIIEINQVRDDFFGYGGCSENFAITYPFDENGTSQIFVENDFSTSCSFLNNQDTIFVNGDTCTYAKATRPLRNIIHNYSYIDEWAKGLRVTLFHEYYHAIQLTYLSTLVNLSFWFEASAAGFEEITNPDIDDYIRYLPSFFESTGIPISNKTSNYGASTLFLYLYKKVSEDLDKSIWENYSKNPTKAFEYQLEAALKELKLDADSLFHDYSVRLSFAGSRASAIKKRKWINEDQSLWYNAKFRTQDSITPKIESLAFNFYRVPQNFTAPYSTDFSNFIGKASVVIYHDGEATIHYISNNKTLDSLTSVLATSDSSTWIFSRFGQSESIPITNSDAAPHAFPVPWRQGTLCFAPLPRDKKFIEIRTRRGDLVSQEKYESSSYCLQEEQVKAMMAPGIYRFRVGNKGKTTSFIVMY